MSGSIKNQSPILFLFVFILYFSAFSLFPAFSGISFLRAAEPEEKDANLYGVPAGPAQVWDFTESVPETGILRKGAKLEKGLIPMQMENEVPAGFELRPANAFSLPEAFLFEAEISPGLTWENPEVSAAHRSNVLWDNMYITYITDPEDARCHRGFQLALQDCGDGRWQPLLYLGFTRVTECVRGPVTSVKPGETVRLAFFYDANRSVFWEFGAQKSQGALASAGAVTPGRYAPVIGDRYGSNFCAFNGTVKRVSITPYERKPLGISIVGKSACERGAKDAAVRIQVENFSSKTVSDVKMTVTQCDADGSVWQNAAKNLNSVEAGQTADLEFPVETRVKPGWYEVKVQLDGKDADGKAFQVKKELKLGVGPLFADRFPTLIWLFNNRPYEEVLNFGFTHGLTSFGFDSSRAAQSQTASGTDALDRALVEGFRLVKSIRPYYPEGQPEENFARTLRDGTVPHDAKGKFQPEVSNPEFQEYARRVAAANAEVFGLHPAFAGVLPNSEIRDGTFPSFRTEAQQYKAQTGCDVPEEVSAKTAPAALAPKRFPDGVVPDDDPLLQYYRWFWAGGDGWPGYNSGIAQEYRKAAGRFRDGSAQQNARPFFSFFDPAVRAPARWGSGGDVDVLSQWVYAVPEPLAVAGPAEELFAMASGRPGQDVMIMTQIICYRAQIAPKTVFVAPQPAWVKEKPDADFPTIPPDSLQEATWAMISKPVQGIMYHGYACIVETGAQKGYTYTNHETPERMRHLLRNVVAPLGPTLKQLPREDSPVAVLESFTGTIFAGHGTWGWIAPDLLFFQRSRLDPRVIYEETILRDGFGNTRVLYAPQCDFLPASVVEKIREFQKKGGILVADELLTPALKADILVPVNKVVRPTLDSTEEVNKMAENCVNDKAQEQTAAAKETALAETARLREALAPKYAPRTDSSSPELITFNRAWEGVPYLFVINDCRTFGDYVGQWGMTMEKGLPFEGFASISDSDSEIQAVYELSRGGAVPFERTEDGKTVRVPLKYDTNDGRLLLFLKSAITSVSVNVPEKVKAGEKCRVEFRVLDADGKPVHALLPVEVRLFDAAGTELDGGGYACAENGICTIEFQTNVNDAPGPYRIQCRDRASGLKAEKSVLSKGKSVSKP